jgi:hypothetical protein
MNVARSAFDAAARRSNRRAAAVEPAPTTRLSRRAGSMGSQLQLSAWREMNRETTTDAEALLLRLWRKWEPIEQPSQAACVLALTGLRRR